MDENRLEAAAKWIGSSRRTALMRGVSLALGGLLLAGAPRPAQAKKKKPKPVYTCAGPADDSISLGREGGLARFAQSFTPSRSGTLKQIAVTVTKSTNDGDYVVQLVKTDGVVPSASPLDVLAAATIPDAQVAAGDVTLVAKFVATALTQGTTYAAVVSRPGSRDLTLPDRVGGAACAGDLFVARGSGAFTKIDSPPLDMIVTVAVA